MRITLGVSWAYLGTERIVGQAHSTTLNSDEC